VATLPAESPRATAGSASIVNVIPAGVIWGFSFLCIKVAVDGMSPVTLAALRIALGAAVVLTAARITGAPLPHTWKDWQLCATYTVVSTIVPFTCFGWAEERIPSALAGVLNGSVPLFTLLVALAVDRRDVRLDAQALLGLGLGFVGVALAAGLGGGDLSGSGIVAGALACLLASACYGVGFVFAKRRLGHMGVITITAGQLIVGTVVLAPLGIGSAVVDGVHLTPTRILAVGILGFVGTGLAFLFNQRAIALVGATRASLVTYIIPVVAVAVGVLLADEHFSLRLLAGGALVVAGVALSRPRPVAVA
jgi:drug/metabolite transporter (DMT)-like permease